MPWTVTRAVPSRTTPPQLAHRAPAGGGGRPSGQPKRMPQALRRSCGPGQDVVSGADWRVRRSVSVRRAGRQAPQGPELEAQLADERQVRDDGLEQLEALAVMDE